MNNRSRVMNSMIQNNEAFLASLFVLFTFTFFYFMLPIVQANVLKL